MHFVRIMQKSRIVTLAGALFVALGLLVFPMAWAVARSPVRSVLELRRERTVIQKWDLSCGAAALATILNYQYGDPVSEKEIAQGLISRQEYLADPSLVQKQQGFSLLDLKDYVVARGYEGDGYGNLTLEDLIELAPVIVPVSVRGYAHFVVFRGVMGDRVLVADPAYGNRTMSRRRFEDAWIVYPETGRVAFAVTRGDGTAPLNRLAPRARDFVIMK